MRRGAGKLQVIFACIFSRPTARNLTRLNACGSWFGAAVFTTATLQPWMTSSLLLNLYSKFGPAQTLRCNVSVGFFNIMQLFMSLCLHHCGRRPGAHRERNARREIGRRDCHSAGPEAQALEHGQRTA